MKRHVWPVGGRWSPLSSLRAAQRGEDVVIVLIIDPVRFIRVDDDDDDR